MELGSSAPTPAVSTGVLVPSALLSPAITLLTLALIYSFGSSGIETRIKLISFLERVETYRNSRG